MFTSINKWIDDFVEKKQLFVLFLPKTVDIDTKGDYYYTIVILHVHFARVAKGCRGLPRQ